MMIRTANTLCGMRKMQSENYFYSDDGLRLFYRLFDQRQLRAANDLPVLCLHGLTRNSRDFTELAAYLAPIYSVVVPDVRGRGFSAYDVDAEHYQPPIYAQDMWRLLDHLGIDRCVIIGTSMGGIIGMIMALQKPQRIAGLVLNDVGPELDPIGLARIVAYTGVKAELSNWADAVALAQRNNAQALPDLTPAQWLEFTQQLFREDESGVPRADYDPAIAQAFGHFDAVAAAAAAWAVFDQIKAAVLVLRGTISDLLSADTVRAMQQRHADLTAIEIPQRGHAPLLNEPESVAAIDAFLKRF
jgi:pimeloyl-ACP methyl ester carboxylesterase